MRDNTVWVSGTVNCSLPVVVNINVIVTMSVKSMTVVAPLGGQLFCDGSTDWEYGGQPVIGRLKPGSAQVAMYVQTDDYGNQVVGASGEIRLKPGN